MDVRGTWAVDFKEKLNLVGLSLASKIVEHKATYC